MHSLWKEGGREGGTEGQREGWREGGWGEIRERKGRVICGRMKCIYT